MSSLTACILSLSLLTLGQDETPAAGAGQLDTALIAPNVDFKQLYKQLLPSTCWIIARNPATPDSIGMGTGWVYDAQRRLVVTNEHVVRDLDTFEVHFPQEQDGKVLVDPNEYLEHREPIKATAIDRDRTRDLALLQLESLPATAMAIPLAKDLPEPGERVITIAGLPDGSEGLWVMTSGIVRLSYRRSVANGAVTGVVETDLPFNRGNSGGPVVNDRGELVAVVEGYEAEARQVSMTVDVAEVRTYLSEIDPLVAPQDARAFLQRGRRRHDADRRDLALADYAEALKRDPQLVMARLNRGWLFYRQDDYNTALLEFDEVLKQDPENVSAYDGRGTCHRELGDFAAAITDLSQAIRRAPTDASLYFRRANTYRQQGKLEKALTDMNRAVEYDPETPDHWVSRGQIHRQLKHFEQAAADISHAWKMDPQNADWLYELAYVHQDFGNNEKAYTLYSMAAELDDQEPRIFNNRGIVLNRLKRHEEALQNFAHAIELKPDHALYYEHTGDTLYYLGRYEAAVEAYNKAIDIDPDVASAYRGRGDAYEALKNTKAAQRDYQRAKQLEKE